MLRGDVHFSGWQRSLGVLLILGLSFLYVPINRLVSGGIDTQIPDIDSHIPLWPIWAVPYLISIGWWVAALIWAAAKMHDEGFGVLLSASILMIATSYVVYLLIPTYTHRPVLTGDGFTLDLMRLIYGNDRSYNALPSGHTYNTALIAVIWSQWQPAWRWLWILITVIVMLATLFTRQHNVLDVLFGLIWGIGAYLAALRSTEWCKRLA